METTDNVIYYPYIRVPQDQWFTQVLLYWDKINSIVPIEYASDPSKLGDYMSSLVYAELVQPIIPLLYINEIPNFERAFIEHVDDPNYPIPHGIINNRKTQKYLIHVEKLGDLAPKLRERGLAAEGGDPWLEVEAYTGSQFMAYLAAALGELPKIKSKAITDDLTSFASFASSYDRSIGLYQEIDKMRAIVLENILPAPAVGVKPREIKDFKEDHGYELINFRNKVENFLIDAAATGEPARSAKIDRFLRETQTEVQGLSRKMKTAGWTNITPGRFLSYSAAFAGLASAIATGGIFGVVAAAFGVGSLAYNVKQEQKGILEGNYAAYALLTSEAFPFASPSPPLWTRAAFWRRG